MSDNQKIDWTKPIEMSDGTPAEYEGLSQSGNFRVSTMKHKVGGPVRKTLGMWWYSPDGHFVGAASHRGTFLTVRNKVVEQTLALPDDDAVRGNFPMFDGLLAYFPNALAAVSEVSKIGNDQHNPGQPMHWARGKSTDHENKIMRHLVDVGTKDGRGVRHAARLAWRALALLQEELEREEGAPMSRASRADG